MEAQELFHIRAMPSYCYKLIFQFKSFSWFIWSQQNLKIYKINKLARAAVQVHINVACKDSSTPPALNASI
jgi:hypothetical protein